MRALAEALRVFQAEHLRLVTFQSKLNLYTQQITSYVDTKDREVAGLMRGDVTQLSSYQYVSFEDQCRAPQEEIRERLKVYAPIFLGASDVLHLGCGRGEFLDVLREAGALINDNMAKLNGFLFSYRGYAAIGERH